MSKQHLGASAEADRAATPSGPSPAVSGIAGIPSADEIRRVTAYLARVASDLAWQAGVGGMETAGSFVSYLAANPEQIEQFVSGSLCDLPPRWHVEGCLSWHGMDGKIHRPSDIREKDGRREH